MDGRGQQAAGRLLKPGIARRQHARGRGALHRNTLRPLRSILVPPAVAAAPPHLYLGVPSAPSHTSRCVHLCTMSGVKAPPSWATMASMCLRSSPAERASHPPLARLGAARLSSAQGRALTSSGAAHGRQQPASQHGCTGAPARLRQPSPCGPRHTHTHCPQRPAARVMLALGRQGAASRGAGAGLRRASLLKPVPQMVRPLSGGSRKSLKGTCARAPGAGAGAGRVPSRCWPLPSPRAPGWAHARDAGGRGWRVGPSCAPPQLAACHEGSKRGAGGGEAAAQGARQPGGRQRQQVPLLQVRPLPGSPCCGTRPASLG
jgi:hypothetical protein